MNLLFLFMNSDLNNVNKFRHEGDGIFALKSYQVRFYGFFLPDNKTIFLCCSASIKKDNKNNKKIKLIIEKCKKIKSFVLKEGLNEKR